MKYYSITIIVKHRPIVIHGEIPVIGSEMYVDVNGKLKTNLK